MFYILSCQPYRTHAVDLNYEKIATRQFISQPRVRLTVILRFSFGSVNYLVQK
jgi:hypothetical protein